MNFTGWIAYGLFIGLCQAVLLCAGLAHSKHGSTIYQHIVDSLNKINSFPHC